MFLVAAAAVCAIAAVRLLLTYKVAGEAYRHVAKRVAVRNTAAEEDEKEMAGEKQPDGKPVTETAETWECPIDFKAW